MALLFFQEEKSIKNSTRWVSHTLHVLRNLLNGVKTHIACYEELQALDNYSQAQKEKCCYYLTKLSDKRFLSFMIYLVDVLESISIFSKISEEKSLTICRMEDTFQVTISCLARFMADPDFGKIMEEALSKRKS